MTEKVGKYILAVDDEESICELISMTLSAQGYHVRTSSSGKAALEMIALESPGLVILDINMPGMSGLDVLETLRQTSHVPVIMLSVRNDAEVIGLALQAGADDYISKPFANKELVQRVKTLIGEP